MGPPNVYTILILCIAEGVDFTGISNTLTFSAAGIMCVEVSVLRDDLLEEDETFSLVLSTTDPAVNIANNVTQVTITDAMVRATTNCYCDYHNLWANFGNFFLQAKSIFMLVVMFAYLLCFVVVTAGFELGSYQVGEGGTVAVCVVTSGVLGRDVLFNLDSNPGIIMHVKH